MDWDEAQHGLNLEEMDSTHREFLALVRELRTSDNETFVFLFQKLIEHTKLHFLEEGRLMRLYKFPATAEHESEHHRVYGDLLQFNRNVKTGRLALARAYVKDGLIEWFKLHIVSMDSALAAHILRCQEQEDFKIDGLVQIGL